MQENCINEHYQSNLCKTFLYLALLCTGLLSTDKIIAQQASLHGDILSVPYIVVDNRFYSAELSLVPDSDPLELELVAVTEIPANGAMLESSFVDNLLFVPDIDIDGLSYWAEFKFVSDSVFELSSSGSNASVISSNLLGITMQPNWRRIAGDASDIGIGADGTVWVLGKDPRPGGFGIYRWNGTEWGRVDGAAVRIDVGPEGNPWIVNDSHQIYRWTGNGWQRLQGDARDIGVGADGTVWVAAGGGIFRLDLDGQTWHRTSGSAVRIDVDPYGNPWVIDHTDDIYKLIAGRWVRRPGT